MIDMDSGTLTPEEVAAIKSINDVFAGYVVAKDWDALMELYTEDVVMMPPGSPLVQGRAALKEWFGAFPPVSAMEIGVHHVGGTGDLAYVLGWYTMTIEMEGADPINDRGKFIEVRKKQADGSWPLAADIFNSDLGHE